MVLSDKYFLKPPKPIIEIVNVVATARVHQTIDLDQVVKNFDKIQYDPSRFPGLVFRIDKPKTSTLIFRTGGMVCTGAKSAKLARLAINTVVARLRKGGIDVKNEPVVHVQNIVASITLGNRIKFEEFVQGMPRIIYEPEQFPGAILPIRDPKVVFLVFTTGKLVCTGGKTAEDVNRAVKDLYATLLKNDWMIFPEEKKTG